MTFLKHSLILWSFLATTLVAQEPIDVTVPLTPSVDAESRGYAIVIGVDTYRDPQMDALSFAVKDAEAVAAYLKGQGWTVSLMRSSDTNAASRPDEKAMVLEEIRFVASGTKRKDRLLFYFSGHGFQIGKENYVCVSGTKHEDAPTALSQAEILDAFTAGASVKKAVILDACRVAPGGRNVMRGFTRKELDDARGIWHLYSAAPGFKSFEPAAGTKLEGELVANGFFTHFLLKGLHGAAETNGDGFLTLVELSMYVSGEMRRLSVERVIRRQVPYLLWDGQVDGDFLLGEVKLVPLVLTLDEPRAGQELEAGKKTTFRGRVSGGGGDHVVRVNGSSVAVRDGRWEVTLSVPESATTLAVRVEAEDRARRAAPRVERTYAVKAVSTFEGRHTEVRKFALGADLVYLQPRTFEMGSPTSETDRESDEDRHTVTLTKGFWMWKTELTQGEWKDVMGTEPWKGKDYVREGLNYPATYVSWNDAVDFCRKLTERERSAGRSPAGVAYRLPTEAEWEYACRADKSTAYSFGDSASSLSLYAWWDENAHDVNEDYAHEVATKLANPWGLYDVHGDVWEWCLDHADWDNKVVTDTYRDGITDPLCQRGSRRVIRGGSWSNNAWICRSANRLAYAPDGANYDLGFRPVLARVP